MWSWSSKEHRLQSKTKELKANGGRGTHWEQLTKIICSAEALAFFHILPSKILFPRETSVLKLKFLAD